LAAHLAPCDRSRRVPLRRLGIHLPLPRQRHRRRRLQRSDRIGASARRQADPRRARLGAARGHAAGAPRLRMARPALRRAGAGRLGPGRRRLCRAALGPGGEPSRSRHGSLAMTIVAVGVSHKQAPIEVRERLAVNAEALPLRLAALRGIPAVREGLLLSTCNRLEIFAVAESRQAADDLLRTLDPVAAPIAVCRFDEDALRHLFRIAASLDSMVLGEAQILGQVKEAAARAQQAGVFGPELQRAFAHAVGAAKRVRTETEIARGAVSLSSVAVEVARKLLGDLRDRSVLLLGAGEMSELAARELRAQGAKELLVANRTLDRAEQLASQVGGI